MSQQALAGFAGDVHHGQRIVRALRDMETGKRSLDFLVAEQRKHSHTAFAYGYWGADGAKLFRVEDGEVIELQSLNIGDSAAFEKYQSIRLRPDIDPAPNATHSIKVASMLPSNPPKDLSPAIEAFMRLFASTSDRTVGGFPTPFLLTADGARLCPYAYSVSDPIADELDAGAVIPHGTAEQGGYGFSLTEMPNQLGMVAYWLQRPGGLLIKISDSWYDVIPLQGTPPEFRASAQLYAGAQVDLWFGGGPITKPNRIFMMRDDNGRVRQAIAQEGNNLETTMLDNSGNPYTVRTDVDFAEDRNASLPFSVQLASDGQSAELEWREEGVKVSLQPADIKKLIADLAQVRSQMPQHTDIPKGTCIDTYINPRWQAHAKAHPSMPGPTVNILHPGFGWVGFVFPDAEARSLGQWLVNAGTAGQTDNASPAPSTDA